MGTGDKSVQCGRKTDSFKMWLMLRARGDQWLEQSVERAHHMSMILLQKIEDHQNFEKVLEPSCTNINFVYVPPVLRDLEGKICEEEWHAMRDKVAPKIKGKMMNEGTLMVAYQPLKPKKMGNFFRMVFHCQPEFKEENA